MTSDGHPIKGVYYSNANASNCVTSEDVTEYFENHL